MKLLATVLDAQTQNPAIVGEVVLGSAVLRGEHGENGPARGGREGPCSAQVLGQRFGFQPVPESG